MVVTTIYVTRHGFRGNWELDSATGTYSTNVPSPTGIPSDPPLAAHGVKQAEELSLALEALSPPITRVYSSPFYRCLQTLVPYITATSTPTRIENGLGEWYGRARFTHPSPASLPFLQTLFSWLSDTYQPAIIPNTSGETVKELHNRLAYALYCIIATEDAEDIAKGKGREERAILICTHAASLIALGRTLTGRMPKDIEEDDFKTSTAGISKFVRRRVKDEGEGSSFELKRLESGGAVPKVDWKDGKGVAGGWDCTVNSDCSHLSGGAERGWNFLGDESFNDGTIAAGTGSYSIDGVGGKVDSKL